MADNSPFILTGPDAGLPNSRTLETGLGLILEDTGAGRTMTINPSGNLQTLANFTTQTDFISYNTINKIIPGSIADGTGIQTVRSTPGVVTVNVVPNTTHQLTAFQVGGVETVPGRSVLNFISSGSASVSVTDNDPVANAANITVHAVVGASTDAKYIVQTNPASPDPTHLSNAQALSDLATGILKSTTTTGIVSTAVSTNSIPFEEAETADYQGPSVNLESIRYVDTLRGVLIQGRGAGGGPTDLGFVGLSPGSNGDVLTCHGIGQYLTWEPPVGGSGINTEIIPNAAPPKILESNTYYTSNNSSLQTFTLPVSPSAGDFYKIIGFGAGGWTVTQNAGQSIQVGDSPTIVGAGGSISSISTKDSIDIYCLDTNNFTAHVTSGQVNVI